MLRYYHSSKTIMQQLVTPLLVMLKWSAEEGVTIGPWEEEMRGNCTSFSNFRPKLQNSVAFETFHFWR